MGKEQEEKWVRRRREKGEGKEIKWRNGKEMWKNRKTDKKKILLKKTRNERRTGRKEAKEEEKKNKGKKGEGNEINWKKRKYEKTGIRQKRK